MLLSGAGLIGLVVFNLWQAVRDADSRAVLNAQVNAEAAARDLKAVLRSPGLLDVLPQQDRFQVKDGALLMPPHVGWLSSPPALDPYHALDLVVQEKLDRATALEFEAGDPDRARDLFDQILKDAVLTGEAKHWITAMAAWQAHRAGDLERRGELARILNEADGGGLAALASSALLHAATGKPLPSWTIRLRLLPPAHARPIFARLRERHVDVSELEGALEETVARRELLLAVQAALEGLLREPSSVARPMGGKLLLFFPDDRGGLGALIPVQELTAVLQGGQPLGGEDMLPAIRWSGDLVYGNPPTDAYPVVPGLLAVQPAIVARSLFTQPWVLGAVMAVLVSVFGLGLFFSLRSLRRESEAMEARAQFLTTVTHELKTPLAGIRLLSEMLEEGRVESEGKQRQYFSLLSGEAARLTMLIENVLDLGRMERGERSYDMRPQAVGEVVREAAEFFRPVAERDGMQLALDLESGTQDRESPKVRLDRGAFVQALLNVMDNARKYAAEGRYLEVQGFAQNGTYQVRVRDRGVGVPADEAGQIFERFHRGARHLDGSIPGVGLGLYLARTILQRHGGDLHLETPADGNGGACFRFVLPLIEAGE